MPEPIAPPAPTEPNAPTGSATPPAAEPTEPLGEGGVKALAAERAARSAAEKTLADLQKQLDTINAANLTDLERAQKDAKDAREAAAKASTEALRYRIAAESGITENTDLILTASDEETMRKQAALWGARSATTPPGPRPDLSQGAQGNSPSGSPEQDFAAFLGAQMGA